MHLGQVMRAEHQGKKINKKLKTYFRGKITSGSRQPIPQCNSFSSCHLLLSHPSALGYFGRQQPTGQDHRFASLPKWHRAPRPAQPGAFSALFLPIGSGGPGASRGIGDTRCHGNAITRKLKVERKPQRFISNRFPW